MKWKSSGEVAEKQCNVMGAIEVQVQTGKWPDHPSRVPAVAAVEEVNKSTMVDNGQSWSPMGEREGSSCEMEAMETIGCR